MTDDLMPLVDGSVSTPLSGQLWAALFESLPQPDREWVVDRIKRYRSLNEERRIEARL